MLEIIISCILGINVGFYVGYLCGKESRHKEEFETHREKVKMYKPTHIKNVFYEDDKPFLIEDEEDIFLKIKNEKEVAK